MDDSHHAPPFVGPADTPGLLLQHDNPRGQIAARDTGRGAALAVVAVRQGAHWVGDRYADFGPTLAAEYLRGEGLRVSKETLRGWMTEVGWWRPAQGTKMASDERPEDLEVLRRVPGTDEQEQHASVACGEVAIG